jgi:hypothetical protein
MAPGIQRILTLSGSPPHDHQLRSDSHRPLSIPWYEAQVRGAGSTRMLELRMEVHPSFRAGGSNGVRRLFVCLAVGRWASYANPGCPWDIFTSSVSHLVFRCSPPHPRRNGLTCLRDD